MKTASVADVKASLSSYIKASKAGPIVVTKNGKGITHKDFWADLTADV